MFEYLEFFGLACIPAFIAIDLVYRARGYRAPRFWRLNALLVTAGAVGVSMWTGGFWGSVFGDVSLLDGRGLGTLGGAAVGIVAYEFVHYGYHRLAHEWTPLWRLGHQMHHAAESLDAFGAYYIHPLDAFLFTTWASLVFFPVLGLAPEAGILAGAFLGFNAVFQHANIRTPRWLGYLIQRPESHIVHHGRGIHRNNYADLPVIDMLFGTFVNPETVEGMEVGFREGSSSRVLDLLAFQDINDGAGAPVPQRAAA
ncbi:MAG: fatty acid hydroxylase [Alphaproteobacteria bacterium]|nr:fatty acid hydroxylase [Alphaproteobacteria bacterium]